ncbi:MAG: ATP-binding cassette domain-containing protein [Pseudomonadota bacterium]|nr:ATP-binding cassette domain-containing protein [Pseudomonadota bacterium]
MNDRGDHTGPLIIDAAGVSKVVSAPNGELRILNDINFAVRPRERVAITGVSGSGKSTMLGLLAGLDIASEGCVRVLDHSLSEMREDDRALLRRHHIGFVFQAFHLISSFTAVENVMLPLDLKGEPDALDKAHRMLVRVGLSERAQHFPRQLSGGEQQRVALARAFCTSPDILFADEPTGNLDAKTADTVVDLLFDLNAEFGTTLIVVTHDGHLADRCDWRVSLAGGRILA